VGVRVGVERFVGVRVGVAVVVGVRVGVAYGLWALEWAWQYSIKTVGATLWAACGR